MAAMSAPGSTWISYTKRISWPCCGCLVARRASILAIPTTAHKRRSVLALSELHISVHSSYERGCQEKKLLPAPGEDAGVVTYIQPHLILRGVIGLAALARRTF